MSSYVALSHHFEQNVLSFFLCRYTYQDCTNALRFRSGGGGYGSGVGCHYESERIAVADAIRGDSGIFPVVVVFIVVVVGVSGGGGGGGGGDGNAYKCFFLSPYIESYHCGLFT